MSTKKHTNSLTSETSPYLLQHAHNPVHWYAWNDETLNLAKAQNKLLLISIGYSSCHWCHVMEEESFENEDVAKIMNQYFINVKVDREERPDIDQIYMSAVQIMSGQGGWPLSIKPFQEVRILSSNRGYFFFLRAFKSVFCHAFTFSFNSLLGIWCSAENSASVAFLIK